MNQYNLRSGLGERYHLARCAAEETDARLVSTRAGL